ncbi:MAG: alpha/beta fold hydrolase [Parcubacteria group bacterium]
MERERGLSINEIFKAERQQFIPEVGEQLAKETTTTVELEGQPVKIDYRVIWIKDKEYPGKPPVVLLPGFGSGWEGISELGFSLAGEGRRVVMPSLPGYGKSENPPTAYLERKDFSGEAEALKKVIDNLQTAGELTDGKVHLVGHSMGSEVIAEFRKRYPDQTQSIVLLNAAGIEGHEDAVKMATRFLGSGAYTGGEYKVRLMFAGEKDYQDALKSFIPKTKSPFSKDRLPQRLAEVKKLTTGHLIDNIKQGDSHVTFISGELDPVYPPGSADDPKSQLSRLIEAVKDKTKLSTSVMAGLRHNTTIAPDEITAANINGYLLDAE